MHPTQRGALPRKAFGGGEGVGGGGKGDTIAELLRAQIWWGRGRTRSSQRRAAPAATHYSGGVGGGGGGGAAGRGAEIAFLKTHGGAGANPFPNNSDATFDAGSLRVVFGSASGRRRPARRAPACLEKRILTLLPKKAIRRAAAACRPRACSLAASPASGLQLRARSPGSGPEPGRWPPGPDLGLGKGRRVSGA